MELIRYVLEAAVDPALRRSADSGEIRSAGGPPADAFDASAAAAFAADRLAGVVAAGYAGAVAAVFPESASRRAAFALTEATGNTARAIETRWDGTLTGTKTFVTLGDVAEVFYVVASRGELPNGHKDLVAVEVDAADATVEPFEVAAFVPELRHARVTFDGAPGRVVREDAWNAVSKPFRLAEDITILGCVTAWFVRLARQTGQTELVHRLVALLTAVRGLAAMPHDAAETAITYAGAHALLNETLAQFDWDRLPTDDRERWQRDRGVLEIAGRARAARTALANERFGL